MKQIGNKHGKRRRAKAPQQGTITVQATADRIRLAVPGIGIVEGKPAVDIRPVTPNGQRSDVILHEAGSVELRSNTRYLLVRVSGPGAARRLMEMDAVHRSREGLKPLTTALYVTPCRDFPCLIQSHPAIVQAIKEATSLRTLRVRLRRLGVDGNTPILREESFYEWHAVRCDQQAAEWLKRKAYLGKRTGIVEIIERDSPLPSTETRQFLPRYRKPKAGKHRKGRWYGSNTDHKPPGGFVPRGVSVLAHLNRSAPDSVLFS